MSNYVKNLSDFPISRNQIEILNKGLSFSPLAKPAKLEIDIENFFNDVRIKSSVHEDQIRRGETQEPLQGNDTAYFREIEAMLKRIHELTIRKIDEAEKLPITRNVSFEQMSEIMNLKKNNEIVIKPADKGCGVVIQNRKNYIDEGERILSDQVTYKKLQGPLHLKHKKYYREILTQIKGKGLLTPGKIRKIWPEDIYNDRVLYFLPKIHKEPSKWINGNPPGRPIVSNVATEGSAISKFISSEVQKLIIPTLVPCVTKNSYDTFEAFEKLRNKIFLLYSTDSSKLDEILFVQADVRELYPSIPPQQAMGSLAQAISKFRNELGGSSMLPAGWMIKLILPQITQNDFIFNGQWYQQIKGIAMGQAWAPAVANLF